MSRVMCHHARPSVRTVSEYVCTGRTGAGLHWHMMGMTMGMAVAVCCRSYEQHTRFQGATHLAAGGAMTGGCQPKPLADMEQRCGGNGIWDVILLSGAWLCTATLINAGQSVPFAYVVLT